jgi:hypothetical protein
MHVGLLKQRKVSQISFINQHRSSHCHQSHVSSVRRSRFSTPESGCSPALQQHSRFEAAQKEVEGDKVGNYALDGGRPKEAWCQFVTVRGVPCVKLSMSRLIGLHNAQWMPILAIQGSIWNMFYTVTRIVNMVSGV